MTHVTAKGIVEGVARDRHRRAVRVALPVKRGRARRVVRE